jgi:hypothetical protein
VDKNVACRQPDGNDMRDHHRLIRLNTDVRRLSRPEFHRERMQEVHSADGPGPLPFGGEGGRILLHVVPFSAFSSEGALDLGLICREYLPPIWCSGYDTGYNADGFYTTSGVSTAGLSGYVQVFRNGVIESAAGDVRTRADQGFLLYADNLENEIAQKIENYMTALSNAGIAPPMLIMLSGIACTEQL